MKQFDKTYKTPSELLEILKQRGLIIENEAKAENYLHNIGYYRLSAYMYPLLSVPKTNDIFWITNPTYVDTRSLDLIKKEYSRSTEDFIIHFRRTYTDSFPPSWIISEILPFGVLTWIYKHLPTRFKKAAAKEFNLPMPVFESWIGIVALTRNACCHHSRIWNKVYPLTPFLLYGDKFPWTDTAANQHKIFYNICIIKYFLNVISSKNDFRSKITSLLYKFPEIDINAMGFNQNWLNEKFWMT